MMSPAHTLVSVVIITHNRLERLRDAIRSVQDQTWPAVEIIVVDDGSDEPGYASYRPKGVRWIVCSPSSRRRFGYPAPGLARNLGARHARGAYIAALDDDDVWFPTKLAEQVTCMQRDGYAISCTEALLGDGRFHPGQPYPVYHREHYGPYCEAFFTNLLGEWHGALPEVFTLDLIRRKNFIIHSTVVLRRDLFFAVGGYREDVRLHGMEEGGEAFHVDHDLWLRCLALGDCLHLNQPLAYYDGQFSAPGRRPSSKSFPPPILPPEDRGKDAPGLACVVSLPNRQGRKG